MSAERPDAVDGGSRQMSTSTANGSEPAGATETGFPYDDRRDFDDASRGLIAAFVVGRGSGFEEADFTDQQRVRVAKDGFAYPLEHVEFVVEAIRAGGA